MAYAFPDASLPDELPGGDIDLPSGAFDPVGLCLATDHAKDSAKKKACEVALGTIAFETVLQKTVPEFYGLVAWAGAKGPGVGGGKKNDIYKVVPLSEARPGQSGRKVLMDKNEQRAALEDAGKPKEEKKTVETLMQRKEFGWKKIYHALLGPTGQADNGGFITEIPFTPTPMRMYTDHRVMGRIVLPGVSHVSLMAATGLVAFAQRDGSYGNDEQAVIKDVLFERPYVVHDGLSVFAPERFVPDPTGMGNPMPGEDPSGVIIYCRASHVSRERGNQRPTVK